MHLKLPRIIGHRGVAVYAPENTLEGLHTAADMGGGVLPIHNDLQRMAQPRTQVHGASYET